MAKKIKISFFLLYAIILTILLCHKYYSYIKPIINNEILVANYLSIENPPTNKKNNVKDEPYLAILEIPKINLKRGFFNLKSNKNSVNKNITLIASSNMPDVAMGNLILAAHRGNSNVSFFDKLPLLEKGDAINIYYNNYKYTYIYDHNYDVLKDGTVELKRDYRKTTITLITCKEKNKDLQTVYIGYLKDKCYNDKKGVDYEE